jgi:NAD(P)-dependent dehydrogenase (short-subunit alcohol dehydrogenase family)
MQDKTVVMTGATSGIGAVAAERLAQMGARIVFVARDLSRADAALARLRKISDATHEAHLADLSSIADVKRAGAEIAASVPRIDVLINNAGAMFSDRRVTVDGLERTFALNHMAYFAFTNALRERLEASAPARIVSTASAAHLRAKLDFADLQLEKSYTSWKAYSRSKLCNILFTRELAKRLEGTGVTANCLHPGFVASRFGDEAGGVIGRFAWVGKLFAISPEKGADTIVWLASSPEVEGKTGGYWTRRRLTTPSREAQNENAARLLWTRSVEIAGVELLPSR